MSRYDASGLKFEFRGLKSLDQLHGAFNGLKDQKTETCGPYSLLKILLSMQDGKDATLTEDHLAQLSGTLISHEEWQVSQDNIGAKESELDEQTRQMYYPLKLGISDKEEELGTSAEGVYHAMETTLGDNFSLVPLPSVAGGSVQFTAEFFGALTSTIWKLLPEAGIHAILNCQMNRLCSNSRLSSFMDVIDFLASGGVVEDDDWKVGHFMVFAGMFSVETASGVTRFYLMQDSYKNKGMHGYRIQPEERVRRALVRDDGREGGILLAVPKGDYDRFLSELGMHFVKGVWNNGTPFLAQREH